MQCDVERGHRHREVHRVPEPEPRLVRLPPRLVEKRVVRVHLLPALAARRSRDLVRTRKCGARLRRRGHVSPPSGPGLYTARDDAHHPPAGPRRAGRPRADRGSAARAGPDGGARPDERGRRQPGRLEDARARRRPRRAALHRRLGRRRRGRGPRPRRDAVPAGRPGLRDAALSQGGGRLRRVRHLALAPARPDPRRARRRRGRRPSPGRAHGLAGARRDGRRRGRATTS